jgi:hypothetical protein
VSGSNQLMLDAIRVAQQMVNDTSQGTPGS